MMALVRRLGRGSVVAALAGMLALIAGAADAQQLMRVQNKWKPDQFLHIEYGDVISGTIQRGWWSAQWRMVAVGPYVRFQNRWKPEQHLHIEYGQVQAGPIEPGWWSAMWTIEQAGEGFVRIRNRWKPDQYLHIERGAIQSGPIEGGWWSAQWRIAPAE